MPSIDEALAYTHADAYLSKHGVCEVDLGGCVEYAYLIVTGPCSNTVLMVCDTIANLSTITTCATGEYEVLF